MFFFVAFFRVASGSVWALSFGGLRSEGERSEPSGAARQRTGEDFQVLPAAATKSGLLVFLLLSLPWQGIKAGIAAQAVPVVGVRSCYPRMAFGQSVTQLDPRTPGALNSNRCLNRGPGHEFVCIRRSRNILTSQETNPIP
jgi:hypothetical protein